MKTTKTFGLLGLVAALGLSQGCMIDEGYEEFEDDLVVTDDEDNGSETGDEDNVVDIDTEDASLLAGTFGSLPVSTSSRLPATPTGLRIFRVDRYRYYLEWNRSSGATHYAVTRWHNGDRDGVATVSDLDAKLRHHRASHDWCFTVKAIREDGNKRYHSRNSGMLCSDEHNNLPEFEQESKCGLNPCDDGWYAVAHLSDPACPSLPSVNRNASRCVRVPSDKVIVSCNVADNGAPICPAGTTPGGTRRSTLCVDLQQGDNAIDCWP